MKQRGLGGFPHERLLNPKGGVVRFICKQLSKLKNMIYLFQKRRWLYISISFLSLCLALLLPLFWNINSVIAY
ncbi:MAG: hypothetical protein AAFX80_24850, partial [Cyanobacteria bacterium J06639_18]